MLINGWAPRAREAKPPRHVPEPGNPAIPERASHPDGEHHPTRDGAPPAHAGSPRPGRRDLWPGQPSSTARAGLGRRVAVVLRPCGVPVPQVPVAPPSRLRWRRPSARLLGVAVRTRAAGAGGPRGSRLAGRGGWRAVEAPEAGSRTTWHLREVGVSGTAVGSHGVRTASWGRSAGGVSTAKPRTSTCAQLIRIEATLAVASILGSRKPRKPARVSSRVWRQGRGGVVRLTPR